MDLNARVVIVTGASSGIGAATALALARAGAQPVLVARSADRLAALSRRIASETGKAPLLLPADITQPGTPARLVCDVVERLGRIDLLVNNAGVTYYGTVTDTPEVILRRVIDLNLWAPVQLIRAVVPVLREQGGGLIVNVSSIVGLRGLPLSALYCASKAALGLLSDAVRLEERRSGIRVMTVFPGLTATRMHPNTLHAGAPPPPPRRPAVSAARVARVIVTGIIREKRDVYVTLFDRLFVAAALFAPGFFDRLLGWRMKVEP